MNDSTSPATRTSQPPVLEPTPVPGELTDALRSARRVALIGHVTPDADCIGALGAMFLALRELGPEPHVAMPPDSVARKLRFLVERAGWQPASAEQLAACDAALVLDTAKPKRVNIEGKLEAVLNARLLVVDHHTSNERFGQVNWVEGDRSSTCEMLYELIATLGVPLTPDIATLLYAGIHSDTQGFSLSNTTCRSLAVAHALADAGGEIIDTCEKLCRSQSPHEFEPRRRRDDTSGIDHDGGAQGVEVPRRRVGEHRVEVAGHTAQRRIRPRGVRTNDGWPRGAARICRTGPAPGHGSGPHVRRARHVHRLEETARGKEGTQQTLCSPCQSHDATFPRAGVALQRSVEALQNLDDGFGVLGEYAVLGGCRAFHSILQFVRGSGKGF